MPNRAILQSKFSQILFFWGAWKPKQTVANSPIHHLYW